MSLTIRVGGYAPPGSTHSRAIEMFRDALAARSDVPVELVYNVMDEGRPATDLLDLVSAGELTWCYFSTSYLGRRVPLLNALEVPFLFDSLDEAHAALDGEFGAALTAATEAVTEYEVLGYWDNGFRHFTNRLRDVRTPEDVAGMRVRLQPNRVHEALITAWGGQPVPAELSEGIRMINDGEVDAQENPLANTAAYGVDHRHLTLTAHLYGARGLYASAARMDELPDDVADAVRAAAGEAIAFQRSAAADYELELRRRFEAEGRTVIDLSEEQRHAFRETARHVIEEARDAVGPEVFG